ncbi:MAG: RraA family protein [SAR202 cluster bacterium]|nr:RraA family protein [SAR202 cluster bacterium]
MITVNPRNDTLSKGLIEAYKKIAPASLGHALDSGMDSAIRAIWKPVKLVGPALTVQAYPQVDSAVAKALDIARPGDVLVMNRGGDTRIANWGEFAAIGAMEAGVIGLVSDGAVTDQTALAALKFPTFARGTSAVTIKRHGVDEGAVNVPVHVGGVVVSPGDLVIADDDGVVVASSKDAARLLKFCQEMEKREVWMRQELPKGRKLTDLRKEWPLPKP